LEVSLLTFSAVDINKRLADCRKKLEGMGAARSDEKSQRAYLGKLATDFERIVSYSRNAYYTEHPIFSENLDMRLVTRIIELNEVFAETFSKCGHTRMFEMVTGDSNTNISDQVTVLSFALVDAPPELADITVLDRFVCPQPSDDCIMAHLEQSFKNSRGPELGTVSPYIYACFPPI